MEVRAICETIFMGEVVSFDAERVRRACQKYGVERLRVFGSAITDSFDPEKSDVDFLVSFLPGRDNLFQDFFKLKSELSQITGRDVDLVMERAVTNPFFKATVFETAQEIYAA